MLEDPQSRWNSTFRLITTDRDLPPASPRVSGKSVLITGAGGSIGSALAFELTKHNPGAIILLDASEQALYRIDRELPAPHSAILGSVCDRAAIDDALTRHRPQIIFHAAAFKHVPLMEFNPFAALQNNAIGSYNLAQRAAKLGVEQVIMVSTDKAVEPASIMGASKRIAELVLLSIQGNATSFKAIRLGNVLASEGSVLPVFQSQIDRGEPLTVTHPDASRYFLTTEHAVQLLLLASADEVAPGIHIPQLGEPIRIDELARSMVSSSNSQTKSEIIYTGLRPGDKLSEKLLSSRESFLHEHESPLRRIRSEQLSSLELLVAISKLRQSIDARNLHETLQLVFLLVPGYQPSAVIQAALEAQAPARANS